MALAQRPALRFFATFYRWNRHTRWSNIPLPQQQLLTLIERSNQCTFYSKYSHIPRHSATVVSLRSYHASYRLHEEQSIHGFLQKEETCTGGAWSQGRFVVEPTQLGDHVRQLMRKIPASVAVITVAHYDLESNKHVPMGIAVSSLNTVTLDPPTISFNIKQPSKALDAIRAANGCFRVHFIEGLGMGRKIIEHFCKGNHPDAYAQRMRDLRIHVPQFDSNTAPTTSLAPRIHGKSVRANAECTLTQELTVGDHIILVAQINSLETKDSDLPTITYVNGTYRNLDSGAVIGYHGEQRDTEQPAAKQQTTTHLGSKRPVTDRVQELSIAYDCSLFPGQKERHDYAERLKAYLKGIRVSSIRDFIKELQPETRLMSKSFGIDLESLIFFCQHGVLKKGQKILPEFYGQLSTAQLAKVSDRAKQLVKADRRFLDAPYTDLLRYLDVQIGNSSLLPSDILNSLRSEGLVSSFEQSKSPVHTYDRNRGIHQMEQAEHAVREHLSTLTDREILRTPLPTILEKAGVNQREVMHFQGSHTRLKVEICSRFYKDWKIDITGEVTPEEARVVVRRLIDYVGVDRQDVFRKHMLEEVSDMMRNVGVHPLVTGINTTYIMSKIRYFHSTTEDFSFLKSKVSEMLQPYFASNITWEDLETRIKQFVQTLPLRAITWKPRDQLAAMGLSGNTTISTPLTTIPQTLDDSNLLETLMAKALKNHYGNGTREENEAIAAFLKDRYGFDVVSRSIAVTPEEALARSSADDLEAARLAHQEVAVPTRKSSAKW